MGMFDYVIGFKCECPLCGGELTEFQTKSMGCQLEKIHYTRVEAFYAFCCNVMIHISRSDSLDSGIDLSTPIALNGATYEVEDND